MFFYTVIIRRAVKIPQSEKILLTKVREASALIKSWEYVRDHN